jgi:K+ transporter
VCALWFATLALDGDAEVAEYPGLLASLSPGYGFEFAFEHPGWFFVALSGVVLAITGVEAL